MYKDNNFLISKYDVWTSGKRRNVCGKFETLADKEPTKTLFWFRTLSPHPRHSSADSSRSAWPLMWIGKSVETHLNLYTGRTIWDVTVNPCRRGPVEWREAELARCIQQ